MLEIEGLILLVRVSSQGLHKRRASEAEGVLALGLRRESLLVDHAADQVLLELFLLSRDPLLLLLAQAQ